MKLLLTCMLALASLIVSAQKKYHCEYKETSYLMMPDSAIKEMSSKFESAGLPAEAIKQFMEQMKSQMLTMSKKRIVEAASDTTVILIKADDKQEGNVSMNVPEEKILLINGEAYIIDSASKKFTKAMTPPKKFNPVDEQKQILGHTCKKYRSEDSTVIVWIAADLPSYINPAVRVPNVKGAVLGFEIRSAGRPPSIGEIEKLVER